MGFVDFLKAPRRHIYNAGDVTWEWTNRDRAIALGGVLAAAALTSTMLLSPSEAESTPKPHDVPPVQQSHIVENE